MENTSTRPGTAQARIALSARLAARRDEIEQALVNRIYAIPDPAEAADPEYTAGLRAAITAALDYALAAIEHGEEHAPPVPPALLSQARMAARNGVGLDTVLRRYFAGYGLLGDLVIQESDGGLTGDGGLGPRLRGHAALFDRLLAAVSEEYNRELAVRPGSSEQRRAERVKQLLAGEPIEASGIEYDLEAAHLGAFTSGKGAQEALRALAANLDCRLLVIRSDGDGLWAWLGARRLPNPNELQRSLEATWPEAVLLALGEPGRGLAGWRLTHRQAQAAFQVALRSQRTVTRYADVALLASMLQDDLLATSVRELFLSPLENDRGGGKLARDTLRAYFAADRNVSSAAPTLGVSRQTMANRICAIEKTIGRSLDSCAAELETLQRLDDITASGSVT